MVKVDKIVAKMRSTPASLRFSDVVHVCDEWFGEPRQNGTSHAVYRTPWPGDPRVNIQRGKNGMAKAYQVRQVVAAIDKITAEQATRDSDREGR